MEVTITTSDPASIDTEEIRDALEALGYYVGGITVVEG